MIYCYFILAVAFITLKLTGQTLVAIWPWSWVLSPLWLPVAVYALLFGLGFIIGWLFPNKNTKN